LREIDAERDSVLRRIENLKAEITDVPDAPDSSRAPASSASGESRPLTSAEKVALFHDLFRGRPDVYPKRWVNPRKRTKGYSPACANEWVRGVCDKPRVRCGECPSQAFLPFAEETILDHFRGKLVAGVYPLLEDETCRFLVADFDKGEWREDVAAFVETCKMMNVSAAIERSRSGDGAHAWIFFQSPAPAATARRMGCFLITETMARRHELPMGSYDRFFPNQDTMPRGGFGNLIALPFQDGPRQQGNSVFVDETWTPYPDQWGFLASVRRMTTGEVESLAREAARRGQVIGLSADDDPDTDDDSPWTRPPSRRHPRPILPGPFPAAIRCVLSQQLFVETAGLSSPLVNQIKRLAAFQNPEFHKKQSMRLSTALTPRVICCAEVLPRHIGLPRGCADDLASLLLELGIALETEDKRTIGDELGVRFQGQLIAAQEEAVKALLDHDAGVFVAPPGSGKTVVGANLVARRRRNTLVLVHRTQLLEQWVAQLSAFLDLQPGRIGQIGAGKRKPNGELDVAMIQSLTHRGQVDDIVAKYGHVIVDECHHVPAVSFERVMREVNARYVAGLTATPRRRDGHDPILKLQLGPVRHVISPRSESGAGQFKRRLIVRDTGFRMYVGSEDAGIQEVYRQLADDDRRNTLILDDVAHAMEEGRSPLLLTERRDHLQRLAQRLQGLARNLIILQGGMKAKDRRAAIERLTSLSGDEERLVLATGRFAGEGFDDARLDTLFLTMPISWKGTLVQYAGRLHRQHHVKSEVRIMDYRDGQVPMLARMFDRRMRGYRAMGYAVGEDVTESDESARCGSDSELF
jgi:superfamily II DNA or RNA helicase